MHSTELDLRRPWSFSGVTWQTTNRRKWQSCIVRTFILKHVPNKLENSDPPNSILREVPWPKETLLKKKFHFTLLWFRKKKSWLRGFKKIFEAKTHPNYAVFNVLRFSPLGALLEVPGTPQTLQEMCHQVSKLYFGRYQLSVGNKHVGTWKLVKREDDVFRWCYLYKGFCMLVSRDGKPRRFHRSVGYTLGVKRNMFKVFKSCFTCLWNLKSINDNRFEKRS